MVIFIEEPGVITEEYCEEDESANLHNPREKTLEECKKIKIELEYPYTSKCKEEEQQIVEEHKLDKHGIRGHPCDQCEYIGAELKHLEQHKLNKHFTGVGGGHPCDICEYVGIRIQHLKQHKLDKHGIGVDPCDEYNYVGAELHDLNYYNYSFGWYYYRLRDFLGANIKHFKQRMLKRYGGHECNQCNYLGAELQDLKQHHLDKHGIGGHQCNQCGYAGSKFQLLRHYKSAHKFENKRKNMDPTGVHAKRIKEDVENIVKLEKQEGSIKQEVYVKSEPDI